MQQHKGRAGHAPSGVTAASSSPLRLSSKPQMGEGATARLLRASMLMLPLSSCMEQAAVKAAA